MKTHHAVGNAAYPFGAEKQVVAPRHKAGEFHLFGKIPHQSRPKRYAVLVVVSLRKFGFHFANVHTRRTLGLAAFARKAQIQNFFDFVRVGFFECCVLGLRGGQREVMPQNIGPCPRAIALAAGGHVAGTHRSARHFGFAAIARPRAFFGKPQEAIFVVKTKNRVNFWGNYVGFVPQKLVHGRRIDNLVGVKDAFRVPGVFDLLKKLVVFLPHHVANKFPAQPPVAVLTRQ